MTQPNETTGAISVSHDKSPQATSRPFVSLHSSNAMRDEQDAFFTALLARCAPYRETCITLTAIHPDGCHPHPSRHIPIGDRAALRDALRDLFDANQQGWGAFAAVGLRRPGLGRWQRGRAEDVLALPALFVDIDHCSPEVLSRLHGFQPCAILHYSQRRLPQLLVA